ncbi:hypothetical protein [Bradyrhizobium australafricanum]|uniref:hypothetical protein n=1 Tax=Bradyrhizobium australafricanum TaxID=2821406 RepID=UPI001CE2EBA8|nr:hypothetical protein [Bradyrhizobium australafricanum]MCA6105205.1 hypothetical protein [Bradyrhizobium australafricanum]
MATIRQRGAKWQVQVRRSGAPPLSKSFLKRKDAEAWARDMEVRADRSDLPADTSILKTLRLSDLIDRYCKEVTPQKRGARVEDAVLARILLDPFAEFHSHSWDHPTLPATAIVDWSASRPPPLNDN